MFNYTEVLDILDKYKDGKSFILEEKAEDGRAQLSIISDNNLFAISLSHKNNISVFKHKKVADWIVLEFLDESFKNINLHLLELKRTITDSSWQKVKEQLKGAYEHSFLLKGLFDYKINDIVCYSAFVYDKLKLQTTTNPILLKASLGNNNQTSSTDWDNNTLMIHDMSIRHIKIPLTLDDEIGKGSCKI